MVKNTVEELGQRRGDLLAHSWNNPLVPTWQLWKHRPDGPSSWNWRLYCASDLAILHAWVLICISWTSNYTEINYTLC